MMLSFSRQSCKGWWRGVARLFYPTLLAALLLSPAHATDNYTYKPNEYVIVRNGKSPDHRFSVAAHGNGDLGYDNFHIYLMAEPGHKKIGPLEEIKENLDTGAEAFIANWSKDSRYVAISYRIDRHVGELKLYRIENRRAYPVTGPTLFDNIPGRTSKADMGEMRAAERDVTWLSAKTFTLFEHRYYYPSTLSATRALGKYGSVEKNAPDADHKEITYGVDFTAEATCELTSGDTYRIISLRPAKPARH